MPTPRHVVFVVEYYHPHVGGGETLFQFLAEGLAQRGMDVTIVTAHLPGTARRQRFNGVQIHRVLAPRYGRRHWFSFLAVPSVWSLIKVGTVIHTNTHNGVFPAWIASRMRGAPAVMTVYEVFGHRWRQLDGMSRTSARLFHTFERIALRLPFHHHVCISHATEQELDREYPDNRRRTVVIYPGVDADPMDVRSCAVVALRSSLGCAGRFVTLYFGRPGYSKGLSYLIASWQRVLAAIPDAVLLLLLADEPRGLFDEAVAQLAPFMDAGQALILNSVPRRELPTYIGAADCVVVPSLSEGFGFSAAEACMLGRPVVATTGGALPEVVSGRYVLVPPRDPDAIARGIVQVWRGEELRSEIRRFSWDHAIEQHLRLYAALGQDM